MKCNHLEERTSTKIKFKRQTCSARLQARSILGAPGPAPPPACTAASTNSRGLPIN